MTELYNEDALYLRLKGGQYWRATKNVKVDGRTIKKDTVLLLESVRDIEEQAHTVILRPHPDEFAASKYEPNDYRFLVQDFLNGFVEEPDYKRIRNEELARVQGRVTELQKELALSSIDPTIMHEHVEEGVQKWANDQKLLPEVVASLPNVPEQPTVIDQTLTVDKVEHMKLTMAKFKVVTELQSGWIKEKIEEISATVKAMTPYYQEQAVAIKATTEDVRNRLAGFVTGIESLDLYVGTGVEVRTLKSGKDASPEIPLTIMQAKLMMDEELSVWADIGEEFDFSKKELFYEKLVEFPSLVNQIFPTERCVVCMATTEREIEYSDNPWVQAMTQQLNENVFLLVRNGENIHVVWSPVESHTRKTRRLFPSEQEMEDIFSNRDFNWETRQYDKRPINFKDVQYTDKMTQFEAAAVHYKRFLILLAGLDHRLNMFGRFYNEPKGLDFMTPLFQSKYLRFIHDDDGAGLLPLEDRPGFDAWIGSRNAYLRSGSRVICMWRDAMTSETAPTCVGYNHRDYRDVWKAQHVNQFDVVIAQREGQNIIVKALVQKDSYRTGNTRRFLAKVNLTRYLNASRYGTGFLVLDAVNADDLETYIHDRKSRKDFIRYVRMFKAAINYLREQEQQEAPTRTAMRKALLDGNIATDAQATAYIDAAVIAWRAAHRGAKLCGPKGKEFRNLLDQMYTISRADQDWQKAQELVEAEGRKPLRLVLSGTNKLSVYASPLESEIDNVLFPMPWVVNIALEKDETGNFRETNRKWAKLPGLTAAETTLHEWTEAQMWKGRLSPVEHFEDKKLLMETVRNFERNSILLSPMEPEIWDRMFDQWKALRHYQNSQKRNRWVMNPRCYIPYGLEYSRDKNRLRIIAVTAEPHNLLYVNAPDKERKEKIVEEYARSYNLRTDAKQRIKEAKKTDKLHLTKLDLNVALAAYGFSTGESAGGLGDFTLEKAEWHLKRTVKTEQENHTYNDAPNKVFWIPSVNIDTSNDTIQKKKASGD
jgi:hypothetical protein